MRRRCASTPQFALPRVAGRQRGAEPACSAWPANLQQQGMKAEDIKLDAGHVQPQARGARRARPHRRRARAQARACRRSPSRCARWSQEIAQTYEQPEAVVRWHYEKPERLAEFEALAVEHNVVEWVLARAQVTDVPTTFDELMAPAEPTRPDADCDRRVTHRTGGRLTSTPATRSPSYASMPAHCEPWIRTTFHRSRRTWTNPRASASSRW